MASKKKSTPSKRKEKRIIDIYFEIHDEQIAKYEKLGRRKIGILYQVGSFYEFYGLEYPDGTKRGCMWQLADELGLRLGNKVEVFDDDPDIKVLMAGIPTVSKEKYYQMAERADWTLIRFEQVKNGDGFERQLVEVTSPGININSESSSNITMSILLEAVEIRDRDRFRTRGDTHKIYGGIAYLDCITGENGVFNLKPQSSGDLSILLDEILKTIIVKNPKHINVYLQGVALDDEAVINAFHLYRTSYMINREQIDQKLERLTYQETVLDGFYAKERGLLPILQQLDLEDATLIHARVSLVLLLEFIALHDKTVISRLSKPKICADSSDYLVMGNNPLEQLDVIDNLKWEYAKSQETGYGRRVSLLELLNKTKTSMGKNAFRNRLSNPITVVERLNMQYDQIEELWGYHTSWMNANPTDSMGSPIYQIRAVLTNIKNIENIVRKIITGKFVMPELDIFYNSLLYGVQLAKYVNKLVNDTTASSQLKKLVPCITTIAALIEKLEKSVNFKALTYLWGDIENNVFVSGVNRELDNLQEKIDEDRHFIDNLIHRFSFSIEGALKPDNPELKLRDANGKPAIKFEPGQYITQSENTMHGIHLVINKKQKEALEKTLLQPTSKPFHIGKYELSSKDFAFKENGSKYIILCDTLKISAVQLKCNIERMALLAKQFLTTWNQELITSEGNQAAIDALCTFIQEIDVIQSITLTSIENGYVRPKIEMRDHSYVDAIGIRHPIIEQIRKDTQYVANDISLGASNTGALLYGFNAIGKSSLMRAIALNIIMAQCGFYVSSASFMYHPYNYLFTRLKKSDDLYAGLSSFQCEMREIRVIMQYADQNSIVLGDELCSTTNYSDAEALVSAGVMKLCEKKAQFIFATHLHSLCENTYIKPLVEMKQINIYHLLATIDPNDSTKLIYHRKLITGPGPSSYAIAVAQSLGLDSEFIKLAQKIRDDMDADGASITLPSPSKYNAEKMVTNCEICGSAGEDVHHINQQCTADSNGMIGSFHKHSKWNLVSLCKPCHINIHSKTPKFKIIGYMQTSNGILLDWRKLDSSTQVATAEDTASSAASSDDELGAAAPEIKPPSPPPSYQAATTSTTPDININQIVREMKKVGKTVSQIQHRLRNEFKIKVSQQEIRDVV
jgi:DNA mismatch repair protein MutS